MTVQVTWTIETATIETASDLMDTLYHHASDEGKAIREILDIVGEEMLGPVLVHRLRQLELNIEQEIITAMSNEITKEIDKQIINDILISYELNNG